MINYFFFNLYIAEGWQKLAIISLNLVLSTVRRKNSLRIFIQVHIRILQCYDLFSFPAILLITMVT